MTWSADMPDGDEAGKVAHLIVPYTRGTGLDLGAGRFKAFPHFIGLDTTADSGPVPGPYLPGDARHLNLFADESVDFIFSSHLLDRLEDTEDVLREWWRVIKPEGHLVLYLPHKDLCPNVGDEKADEKRLHDFVPNDLIKMMGRITGDRDLTVREDEVRSAKNEYSFLLVFQKWSETGGYEYAPWVKPDKSCLVIRYGAFGDAIMTASIFPRLKEQGYHLTLNCTPRCFEIIGNDPHLDAVLLQNDDQVPQGVLVRYWERLSERYDHVVNLCESVENSLLADVSRVQWTWVHKTRHRLMNVNYLERTHDIAAVGPGYENARTHFSEEEIDWAKGMRYTIGDRAGEPFVVWSLSGSAVHKTWPHTHIVVAWLLEQTNCRIILVGGDECQMLEEAICQGWLNYIGVSDDEIFPAIEAEGLAGILKLIDKRNDGDHRVITTSGVWSIRYSMAFASVADVVVGPETGVLNAVGMLDMPKVVLLSHSSEENLTKHWKNTEALTPDRHDCPCYPCHMLHRDFTRCREGKTGAALCAELIRPASVYDAIIRGLSPR